MGGVTARLMIDSSVGVVPSFLGDSDSMLYSQDRERCVEDPKMIEVICYT